MTENSPDACDHDVILNGACFYCGTTELDGVQMSPKPADEFIPASRLSRGPTGHTTPTAAPTPRPARDQHKPDAHPNDYDTAHDDRE